MKYAGRMSRLKGEAAFAVLARAKELERQGRDIVHLEIGEPDFPTPQHIKDAAYQAMMDGYTKYGPSAGFPEVREAIAADVSARHGIPVDPAEVVVTVGAKPILFYTILALADEDAEVIYPDPGFPSYESVIGFAGAKPVPIELRQEDEFRLSVDRLLSLVTERTRLIVLNSPHNPTGSVLTRSDLTQIAEVCLERDLWVLSDEPYSLVIYDREHSSIASLPGMKERTVLVDGFSKRYSMTGWRLGYGVANQDMAARLSLMQNNDNSCCPSFVQMAGLAALRGPQDCVAEMVAEFRARRDLIVAGLNALPGVSCVMPHGAFYVFPDITGTGRSEAELAESLLDEAGVALLPGTAFGAAGQGFLRLSYVNSQDNIRQALERMESALTVAAG